MKYRAIVLINLLTVGCHLASGNAKDGTPERRTISDPVKNMPCDIPPKPRSLARNLPANDPLVAGAQQTALLIPQKLSFGSDIVEPFKCADGLCRIDGNMKTLARKENLCSKSSFKQQEFSGERVLRKSACAAVAVGKNKLITAKHCVNCETYNEYGYYVIFDYTAANSALTYPGFAVATASACSKPGEDAIDASTEEKANRGSCPGECEETFSTPSAEGLVILSLATDHNRGSLRCGTVGEGEKVMSFGFPLGLPLVAAGPGTVTSTSGSFLEAELRHHRGNSGGPLFSLGDDPRLVAVAHSAGARYVFCRTKGQDCADRVMCPRHGCNRAFATPLSDGFCESLSREPATSTQIRD